MSYGLYIITTEKEGVKAGFIGNAAFQVTSEPPRIAISCNKKNNTTQKILDSKIFSLSVLGQDADTSIIGSFGFMTGVDVDKFARLDTFTAVTGAPVVTDSSVAWFDCRVIDSLDVGSHMLIIGEVADSGILSDEPPLTYAYYREKYRMLAPKNAPTYIDREKLEAEKAEETTEYQQPEKQEKKPVEVDDDDADASYTCSICGFHYNPEEGDPTAGIPPGTPFSELPDDYRCPICNAEKEYFRKD